MERENINNLNTLNHIPVNKVKRATSLVSAGVKLSGNYLRYYGEKVLKVEGSRGRLDKKNARDIYDSLKTLKGSALKVAQMLSMENNLLPSAYVEQFSLSQFSVPPLSWPLVNKLVKKYLGKSAHLIFDTFDVDSKNAASIGQVHQASLNGKELAVKIQYPGVRESIYSDLSIIKPFATRMFNLRGKDIEKYFKEVENKLIEETNYALELEQSQKIAKQCNQIPSLKFPTYYPELSTEKILTMDWMNGIHLSEFNSKYNKKFSKVNSIGQTLWDFYMHQIHHLREVHADPHPGNFLIDELDNLIVLDFGCVKSIPNVFYNPYFELPKISVKKNQKKFKDLLFELEILRVDDNFNEIIYLTDLFGNLINVLTKPFTVNEFDFGNNKFWNQVNGLAKKLSSDKILRKINGNRGSKHFIYMNRTFFGLYSLLNQLGAKVNTQSYKKYFNP